MIDSLSSWKSRRLNIKGIARVLVDGRMVGGARLLGYCQQNQKQDISIGTVSSGSCYTYITTDRLVFAKARRMTPFPVMWQRHRWRAIANTMRIYYPPFITAV